MAVVADYVSPEPARARECSRMDEGRSPRMCLHHPEKLARRRGLCCAGVSVDDEAGALCVGDASDDRIARTLAAEVLRDAGAEVRAGAVEALAKALLAAVTNL